MPRHPLRPRLDPRGPFVVDTRELGRRPGAMRRVQLVAPAGGMGTAVIGVPAGAEVALDLRLESVLEGVLVTGTARAPLSGECARCLEPVHQTVEVDLQRLYVYGDLDPDCSADDDFGQLLDDRLDVEPAVRDAIVLDLPLSPLCRPDCPGLCAECGARLAEQPPGHRHDATDPRWAVLASLRDNGPVNLDQES